MKIIYIMLLIFSFESIADEISNYRYYQIWPTRPSSSEIGSVYIKKDDPCITVYNKKKDSRKRYCEMGDSQLNLEKSYPTIYPTLITFDGAILDFFVAAPWAEQKCSIDLSLEEIQCESTGK